MENSIVKEFQNLQVLTAYDFQRMDELVQDLTNALEETAQNAVDRDLESPALSLRNRHPKKRKTRKRRCNVPAMWEQGNFSEASESSLDEALKDYMQNVVHQQSDSDDLIRSACRLPTLAFGNLSHSVALVESDSVTENFSPNSMRPHRRRRRGQRMAVDPHPDTDISELDLTSRNRPHKYKVRTLETKNENVMDIERQDSQRSTSEYHDRDGIPMGKLKVINGMSCGGPDNLSDSASSRPQSQHSTPVPGSSLLQSQQTSDGTDTNMETGKNSQESSVGSSSSESDGGVFTNDDGGDGDDEQSDFFCDTDPACGVQGIIPWWESEKTMDEEDMPKDNNFDKILTGTFDFMSTSSKRTFKARVSKLLARNREIRVARRRLKERRSAYPMSRYMCESLGMRADGSKCGYCRQGGSNQSGDVKRQKRTLPISTFPNEVGYFVGGDADPIPDSNIGSRMLQNMGWTPGTGLGTDGSGLTNPIMAYVRPKRKGLGGTSS